MGTVTAGLHPPQLPWTLTSATLTVTFNLPASMNSFYQINTIEKISGLQFVTNLVAMASGVITGGSLRVNLVSYLLTRWGYEHLREKNQLEEVLLS